MNYVKHLSIALLLVLGSSVAYAAAPAKVIKSIKTPNGASTFTKDAAGKWTCDMVGKAGDVRETAVFAVDPVTGVPSFKTAANADIALTVDYEPVVAPAPAVTGIVANVKSFWNDRSPVQRYALGIGIPLVIGGVLYKFVPAVNDAGNNVAAAAQDFANDVKDNNGNARRNAAIITAVAVAGAYAAYDYKNEYWIFKK